MAGLDLARRRTPQPTQGRIPGWMLGSLVFFVAMSFIDLAKVAPNGEVLKWGPRLYFIALSGLAAVLWWRPVLRHFVERPVYAVLFGWFLVSAVLGVNPQMGLLRWALMAQFVLLAACFAATVPAADVHRMTFYGLAAVAALNVLAFVFFPSLGMDVREGFSGVIGDKNIAGQFYTITIIVAFYYALAVPRRTEKALALAVSLVGLAFLIETRSKTSIGLGLLGISLCALYYFCISRNRRVKIAALVLLAFAASAATLWAGVSQTTLDDVSYAFEDVTFSGRTTIWQAALALVAERPWTGQGFGSFWQAGGEVNGFAARQHLDYMQTWIDDAKVINQAHNGYLDLVISVGAVGAVLVVGAFLRALAALQRLIVATPVRARERFAYMMAHSSIIALLLNNLLESTLFYSPIYGAGGILLLLFVQANQWRTGLRRAGRGAARSGARKGAGGLTLGPTWSR